MLIGVSALLPAFSMAGAYAGAALAGFGGAMNDIPRSTLMQTVVPARDVAAAFRAWMVATNGGILVAMAVAPTLFAVAGVGAGVALCGTAIVATGVQGVLRRVNAGSDCQNPAIGETEEEHFEPLSMLADSSRPTPSDAPRS
jgi:hypothetical protein